MEKLAQVFVAPSEAPPPSAVDVQAWTARIRRTVRRETRGGVSQLKVDVDSRGIRLRGKCGSFYLKQLAQQAAMRLGGQTQVDNQIEVGEQ